jgi:hypothetical protein
LAISVPDLRLAAVAKRNARVSSGDRLGFRVNPRSAQEAGMQSPVVPSSDIRVIVVAKRVS